MVEKLFDFEYQVYTRLATVLRAVYPDIYITSNPHNIPSEPLCVAIWQEDASIYQKSMDSEPTIHHMRVYYNVNIYSNKETGARDECKDVFRIIAAELYKINFIPTFSRVLENLMDESYQRLTSRFQAVIQENGLVYRR